MAVLLNMMTPSDIEALRQDRKAESIAQESAAIEGAIGQMAVKSVLDPDFTAVWAMTKRIEDLRNLSDLRRPRLDADCASGSCGPGAAFLAR
jgi:hypothetical protein